mgnify:CR=1 FL=1
MVAKIVPRIVYRHQPATRFIVSAIGEPGQRQFFLQVKSESGINAVTLEKTQVMALTERFEANDKFANESIIIWNVVEEMGIKLNSYPTQEAYIQ